MIPTRLPSWYRSTQSPHAAAAGSRVTIATGIKRADPKPIANTSTNAAAETPAARISFGNRDCPLALAGLGLPREARASPAAAS